MSDDQVLNKIQEDLEAEKVVIMIQIVRDQAAEEAVSLILTMIHRRVVAERAANMIPTQIQQDQAQGLCL